VAGKNAILDVCFLLLLIVEKVLKENLQERHVGIFKSPQPAYEWALLIHDTNDPDLLLDIVRVLSSGEMVKEKEVESGMKIYNLVRNALDKYLSVEENSVVMLLGRFLTMDFPRLQDFKLIAIDAIISRGIMSELKDLEFLLYNLDNFLSAGMMRLKQMELRDALKVYSIKAGYQQSVSGVIDVDG